MRRLRSLVGLVLGIGACALQSGCGDDTGTGGSGASSTNGGNAEGGNGVGGLLGELFALLERPQEIGISLARKLLAHVA